MVLIKVTRKHLTKFIDISNYTSRDIKKLVSSYGDNGYKLELIRRVK